MMTTAADYGGRACVRVRVRERVCILLIGRPATRAYIHIRVRACGHACVYVYACVRSRARARMCASARARGHDDFGKHGGLCRPMAARLLAGQATTIRDDERERERDGKKGENDREG